MTQPSLYTATKAQHPYYRDVLTQNLSFAAIGNVPVALLQWAISPRATQVPQLLAQLEAVGPLGMDAQSEHALKLMLVYIVTTNGLLPLNNPHGEPASPELVQQVHSGLMRVLELAPNLAYIENTVRLLFRLNAIEAMMGFVENNRAVCDQSFAVRHLVGFVHLLEGHAQQALDTLKPIFDAGQEKDFFLADLMMLSARYQLGALPASPIRMGTLAEAQPAIPAIAPFEMVTPLTVSGKTIVVVACDRDYFYTHAQYLACSLHATNADTLALHLHVYGDDSDLSEAIEHLRAQLPGLDIGLSREVMPDRFQPIAKLYYACMRFVRLQGLLAFYRSPLCLIDADSLVRGDWKIFCREQGITETTEIACIHHPHAPLWERVTAGFLYLSPGIESAEYIQRVAAFVADNIANGTNYWFLDQIGLSTVHGRFAQGHRVQVAMSQACDLHHRDGSFLWTVTNAKQGYATYNAARDDLAASYGMLPVLMPDHFYRKISAAGNVFFLQIGAMDGSSYDPISPYVKAFGWRGILVEPLPDMMDATRAFYAGHEGLAFENVAIAEREESRPLYRIPPARAKEAGLPHWVLGMSSLVAGKLDMYADHVVEERVRCVPLSHVLDRHAPSHIHVLQIDTEGYDFTIFKQLDLARYRPELINLEYVNLAADEREALRHMLTEHGYHWFRHDLDLFAYRRELAFDGGAP